MAKSRHIDAAERRARLVLRQLPEPAAQSAEQVTESLVALHSTDPASVFLSVAARSRVGAADVERALYDDRTLVRMAGMRRTVFVVTDPMAAVVHSSTTAPMAEKALRDMLKLGFRGGTLDAAWVAEVEDSVVAHLSGLPEATSTELSALEPRLREPVVYAPGTKWETEQTAGTRIMRKLAMDGRIVRGRPKGSWTSSQYRWQIAPVPLPDLPATEARAALVRAWLASYGPGTEADLKWWTGWTLAQVRAALKAVAAVPVTLDEGTGFVLPDDVDAPGAAPDRAALLPALDPTPMGWQGRGWYFPDDAKAALFDRSGNVGPTVWWQGRVVGGWAQRADGEVVWRLLADVGTDAGKAVAVEAERLAAWIGGVRVTPRFRTALERELAG